MTNEQMFKATNEIYNCFWIKWRNKKISGNDWSILIQESRELAKRYPFKFVRVWIIEMQDELEKRNKILN